MVSLCVTGDAGACGAQVRDREGVREGPPAQGGVTGLCHEGAERGWAAVRSSIGKRFAQLGPKELDALNKALVIASSLEKLLGFLASIFFGGAVTIDSSKREA